MTFSALFRSLWLSSPYTKDGFGCLVHFFWHFFSPSGQGYPGAKAYSCWADEQTPHQTPDRVWPTRGPEVRGGWREPVDGNWGCVSIPSSKSNPYYLGTCVVVKGLDRYNQWQFYMWGGGVSHYYHIGNDMIWSTLSGRLRVYLECNGSLGFRFLFIGLGEVAPPTLNSWKWKARRSSTPDVLAAISRLLGGRKRG
jgi:hypothetical protein